MPQIQLPIFPQGVTHITLELAFEKREGRVTYFIGTVPVFSHDEGDVQTFRMITSQFCVNGNVTQAEVVEAFGVPLSTVKRYCRLYREKGPAGFYAPRPHRGAAVLTQTVLQQAQDLLDGGEAVADVAQRLAIKRNTLAKAVRAGRVHVAAKKKKR
jgi:hypothetical protein